VLRIKFVFEFATNTNVSKKPSHYRLTDGIFRKKTKLKVLRQLGFRGEILSPEVAVTYICDETDNSLEREKV
jgi:hypothetical protein